MFFAARAADLSRGGLRYIRPVRREARLPRCIGSGHVRGSVAAQEVAVMLIPQHTQTKERVAECGGAAPRYLRSAALQGKFVSRQIRGGMIARVIPWSRECRGLGARLPN